MAEMRVIETIKNNQEGKWICISEFLLSEEEFVIKCSFHNAFFKVTSCQLGLYWTYGCATVIKAISIKSVVNN